MRPCPGGQHSEAGAFLGCPPPPQVSAFPGHSQFRRSGLPGFPPRHAVRSPAVCRSIFWYINHTHLKVPDYFWGNTAASKPSFFFFFKSTITFLYRFIFLYFNAFLTGSVEACYGGKGKRFMVLVSKIMRRKKTQFIHHRHSRKCNSLFCLRGTSLFFCLFVRSTVSPMENSGT